MSETVTHTLIVSSDLSTANNYNKILGIFENPLPAPFDSVFWTALISILLWVVIGALITVIAIPILTKLACTDDDPIRPKFKKMLVRWLMIFTLVYAFVNTLCVLGVSELTIAAVKSYADFIYLLIF